MKLYEEAMANMAKAEAANKQAIEKQKQAEMEKGPGMPDPNSEVPDKCLKKCGRAVLPFPAEQMATMKEPPKKEDLTKEQWAAVQKFDKWSVCTNDCMSAMDR